MNRGLKKAIAESYRSDLLEAIEKAKHGMLPPSMQEYCFEEIAAEKGQDTYPENGDTLIEQLRSVLAGVNQITELQYEKEELSAKSIELLWFESIDRYTFAEVTYQPTTREYDGRIYIDSFKHKGDLQDCVSRLKKSFIHWQAQVGLQPHIITYGEPCDHCDGRFASLQQASDFVYTGLCDPENL